MGNGKVQAIFPLLVATLLCTPVIPPESKQPREFYWNTRNTIFQTNNTMVINRGIHPRDFDVIKFICPLYPKSIREEDTEKYVVYNVTKKEYDTCSIMDPNSRIIIICTTPYEPTSYTIAFRWFTPTPGAIEVQRGDHLYLMSTSRKWNGETDRVSSPCLNNHMKMTLCVYDDRINHIGTPLDDNVGASPTAQEPASTGVPISTVEETTAITTQLLGSSSELPNGTDVDGEVGRSRPAPLQYEGHLLTLTWLLALVTVLAIFSFFVLLALSLVQWRKSGRLESRVDIIERRKLVTGEDRPVGPVPGPGRVAQVLNLDDIERTHRFN